MQPTPDRFDPFAPDTLEDPYPFYASLREHAPVYEVAGAGVFLVSTWKLVEEALARHADFSAKLTGILVSGAQGGPALLDLTGLGTFTDSISNADEPEHAAHRAVVQPAFAPALIGALGPELRRRARERIGSFVAAGGGEFTREVSEWIPTWATARVAGLPLDDFARLERWGMTGGDLLAATVEITRMPALGEQTREMAAWLDALLEEALGRARAGDASRDAMADRVARAVLEGVLPRRHALGILVVLLGAGIESTASLIGSAVRLLASQPALQARLRAEPALVPAFVEEIDRERAETRQACDELWNLREQLLKVEHRGHLAPELEKRTRSELAALQATLRRTRPGLLFYLAVGAALAGMAALVVLRYR